MDYLREETTIELLHALAVVVGASAIDKENLPQIEDILSRVWWASEGR